MTRINNWLKKRRRRQVDRFMEGIRQASPEVQKKFLEQCVKAAYNPLYLAMVTLRAANFLQSDIIEETTGEKFHIELRKIKKEDVK